MAASIKEQAIYSCEVLNKNEVIRSGVARSKSAEVRAIGLACKARIVHVNEGAVKTSPIPVGLM